MKPGCSKVKILKMALNFSGNGVVIDYQKVDEILKEMCQTETLDQES